MNSVGNILLAETKYILWTSIDIVAGCKTPMHL